MESDRPGRFTRLVDVTVGAYHRSLLLVLRHQPATLIVTALTLVATIMLYVAMPKGFLPQQDTGLVVAVMEAGPEVSFAEMERLQGQVIAAVKADHDVTGTVAVAGVSPLNPTPNVARITIALKPRNERTAVVGEIIPRLQALVAQIAGVKLYFQPVQDIQISTRSSRAQYQYTLSGTSAAEVGQWAAKLAEHLSREPALADIASEAQEGGLRAMVKVDREVAGRLGVSMQAVTDALNDAFGQRQISTIYEQSNQYRVVLEAMPRYQLDPSTLDTLYVGASGGQQVPLSSFARIERTTAPLAIAHQEQFPAVTLSFNLTSGSSLGNAVKIIRAAEAEIGMPPSVIGSFFGDASEFSKSLANQPWLLLAATITIYIVLGILYESFIHPLTILSTLPSAGVGALLALELMGHDLSVVGLIGIVLLMGIVKKNAIMMIDFALEAERGRGMSPREAIVEACLLRFRPIMMTTLAALFGALPLALEGGTGSELRNPLGIAIVGGLVLSQLLTLYTTPVIYLALDRIGRRFSGRTEAAPQAAE